MPSEFVLHINGQEHRVVVDSGVPLLHVLRNELGLTASKFGCGLEQCYACAVLVDGEVVTSCASAVETFVGKRITTLEGLGSAERLDPVQEAFLEEQAAQCGYCTSGIILAAKALLDRIASPTDDEIKAALAQHLCRCGSHPRVIRAVRRVARA